MFKKIVFAEFFLKLVFKIQLDRLIDELYDIGCCIKCLSYLN